ncbi:MAG: hypothetical protein ACMUJM_06470 [bacterium]
MFITDKLIYLELQKTGSTYIASLMSKCVEGTRIGRHNLLKDYETNKFIVGSIRNPWDWYVSLWAFGCGKKGELYNRLTNRKIISHHPFHELAKPIHLWKDAYKDYTSPNCFQSWLRLIHDTRRKMDIGENYYKSSICEFGGLMTYRYCKFYLKNFLSKRYSTNIHTLDELKNLDKKSNILKGTIRNESIKDDLIRVLHDAGHTIDKKIILQIYNNINKKINQSEHLDPKYYYDKETIGLVAQRDKFLIEKYSYAPPL